MFVDYAKINVQAGDGGDGCVSFRREKYVPRGGPDGGDGGRGGHVWLIVDEHMATLLDLKMRPLYTAKRGSHGGGNQCTGRDAEDIFVKVPLGTVVSDAETGEVLYDLVRPGETFLAGEGGRGGKGNQHFASSSNKAPRKWEYGGDGQKRTLILELKVIADVGLVGLPNAGKSTLLAALTKATPKVGAYPFTTLSPNLGVLEFEDGARCVLADIPGLIEGAHHGAGLGDRFLRHVERTNLLVHLVAPPDGGSEAGDEALDDEEMTDKEESAEPQSEPAKAEVAAESKDEAQPAGDEGSVFDDLWYAWELVNAELRQYSSALARKPQIAVLTKTDLMPREDVEAAASEFRRRGVETLTLSSHSGEGLDDLKARLEKYIRDVVTLSADDAPDVGSREPPRVG